MLSKLMQQISEEEKSSQLLLEDEVAEDIRVIRDLSAWRVEIPEIRTMRRDDEKSGERVYVFAIHVKRIDINVGEYSLVSLFW